MCGSLGELRSALAAWASRFDPARVSAVDWAEVVRLAAAIKNIAATVESLAAAHVADTSEWRGGGDQSAAEWLARTTGTTASQAKRAIETGQQLEGLSATAETAKRGDLSPEQASTIADAAIADPAAESVLLAAAGRESLGELRERCRRTKAAADPDPDATYRRLHAGRTARHYTDAETAWNLHVRTTPDAGGTIASALDQITDELFRHAYREGRREPRDAYAADAVLEMALRARDGTAGSGDGQAGADHKRGQRFLALIRADLDALVRGSVEGDEVCEIAGVGPIPVAVARQLLGDSILKLVLTRGVDVANVTHLGRGPTVAQKVALLWSQPSCEVEGCPRRARLEVDHLEPWAETHHTRLDELGRKCPHHHDLKTNHGWDLVPGTGKRPMVPPDDPRHPRHRRAEPDGPDPPPDADDRPTQRQIDLTLGAAGGNRDADAA